jgi:hypothetical protein
MKAALLIDQRRALDEAATLYFTDKNDVITLRVLTAIAALKPGQCAFQNRQTGAAHIVFDAAKSIALAICKLLAQTQLRIA